MRIEIPSRRFFIIVAVIFALLFISGAFAVYDPSKGSHDTLWTDRIEPKTASRIIVAGDMEVTGTLTASSLPGTPPSTPSGTSITCDWTGWSNDGQCPVQQRSGESCTCSMFGGIRAFCQAGKVTSMDRNGCLDCQCSTNG
jgi:hypothetical protein